MIWIIVYTMRFLCILFECQMQIIFGENLHKKLRIQREIWKKRPNKTMIQLQLKQTGLHARLSVNKVECYLSQIISEILRKIPWNTLSIFVTIEKWARSNK